MTSNSDLNFSEGWLNNPYLKSSLIHFGIVAAFGWGMVAFNPLRKTDSQSITISEVVIDQPLIEAPAQLEKAVVKNKVFRKVSPPSLGIAKESSMVSSAETSVGVGEGTTLQAPVKSGDADQGGDDGNVFSGFQVSVLPKVLREIKIAYPNSPKDRGIEGKVILKILVGKDGKVKEVALRKGLDPELDRAAIEGVKLFLFSPAKIGDKPVSVYIDYTYVFILDS